LFHLVPRTGWELAAFGRERAVACDLGVKYDRSVFAGREEILERELVSTLLMPGASFVDAGADVGLFTVYGA